MTTFHYIISGKVQGVGYRFYVGFRLEKLGVKGLVRNLDSGEVELFMQGDEEQIFIGEKYIKMGTPWSKVENIEKEIIEMKEFSKFNIEYWFSKWYNF